MNRKAMLDEIDKQIQAGPFHDQWDSLAAFQMPGWFQESKFGIFIHWGVYSVPAFGSEWYPRNMYIQSQPEYEHHLRHYGPHREFGYKDFIPMFTADKYDPHLWADLIKQSGARYVVPVAEHHDGFQMYPSRISAWNAANMGPKRDVMGELLKACGERGIVSTASSHRAEHWFFMGHGKEFDSDIHDPLTMEDLYWPAMKEPDHLDLFSEPAPSQAFLEDWLLRTCELVDLYQPQLIYFDWWIQHSAFRPWLKKFTAYYYNRGVQWEKQVAVCYKYDAYMFGSAILDMERGKFASTQPFYWQTDTSVAKNSWGYTEGNQYKSAESLICELVDVVSKNGNLLLNIGPRADGTIPGEDREILLAMGRWLKTNGEAIYGTKPWRRSEEGPTKTVEGPFADQEAPVFTPEDIRFTVGGSNLYATVLKAPANGRALIRSLALEATSYHPAFHGIIRQIMLLGKPEARLHWSRDEQGLHIQGEAMESDLPIVFKIVLD